MLTFISHVLQVDDFFTILGNHNIPEYLLACHQKAKGKLASIMVESKGTGEPKGSGKLNESSERKESHKSSNGRRFSNENETRDKRNVITIGGKFEKSNIEFDVLHRKITEMMENGNKFKYYKQNDDFHQIL